MKVFSICHYCLPKLQVQLFHKKSATKKEDLCGESIFKNSNFVSKTKQLVISLAKHKNNAAENKDFPITTASPK